ncbi:M3 family oligoendopeptidase [Opitutales bacterium ASA1]|uniref:M3 family metallopeptidase n=1 Tax=Congregicoccus parvus TaxID=3081749 RepID=UPI002B321F19|nr:M3 family oligoendopeptidase [Opitutales bacterium ASA1]
MEQSSAPAHGATFPFVQRHAMDWKLDDYFPDFDGSEYRTFKKLLGDALAGLAERIEALEGVEPSSFAAWQAVIEGFEDVSRRISHLSSYTSCLSACDAADEHYKREEGALALLESDLQKLDVALAAAFGSARQAHFDAFVARDSVAGAAFAIRRWRERARRLMSMPEETLAAELEVDGLKAWSRLYDTVSGTLEFTYTRADGMEETVPMARRRSLLSHPDRAVRASVFARGNVAWERVAPVCAAALNAIAGARLTLCNRRRQSGFLEPALFEHRIGAASLEALRGALREHAPVTRRMLRLKARGLGLPAIAWYDLEAPTPGLGDGDGARLDWPSAVEHVRRAIGGVYPAFGDFVQEMVDARWIEHSPRRGKRPGAFCTGSALIEQSRIFMTFDGTMGDVVTFAHEAGHAWHSRLLRATRPLARGYPMTLAESASTFAEMLFIDGVLNDPAVDVASKRRILDSQVRQAAGFLLDVPMRYEFEHRFHEERSEGEVSATRLRELMVEAQRALFGDALEQGQEDPLFWASKLHFYIAEVPFYNFPYTVGFLLSRALFARFKQEGASFLPTFETFLARSGSATCEELARDVLGADLESPAFWASAIESTAEIADRMEALLPA